MRVGRKNCAASPHEAYIKQIQENSYHENNDKGQQVMQDRCGVGEVEDSQLKKGN